MTDNSTKTTSDAATKTVNDYVQKIKSEKQKLIDTLTKEEMVNLIFKQNNLMAQQSSQMLDIVDMANNIENSVRKEAVIKCNEKIQNTCGSRSNTGSNTSSNSENQKKLNSYNHAMRTHVILLILLVVVILWLIYHHMCAKN
jgi:hypothetical protein